MRRSHSIFALAYGSMAYVRLFSTQCWLVMSKVDWHFPRTELAERVYSSLVSGPIQGLSICAPLRAGKTRFLTHDLAPFAKSKGHRVVYASFWQTSNSPLDILLYEFDRALRAKSLLGCLKSLAGCVAPQFLAKTADYSTELKIGDYIEK